MSSTKSRPISGFTIVELLVVIVVIGVLAAITIVSYSGISSKAIVASLKSDLDSNSRQFKIFQVTNGNYPATISTDCKTQPDTTTNKCIKLSGGNQFDSYDVNNTTNPQTFTLTLKNGTNSYDITEDSIPGAAPVTITLDGTAFDNGAGWGADYGEWYDPDSGDSGCSGDYARSTSSTFNLTPYSNGTITNASLSWTRVNFWLGSGGRNKYLKRNDTGVVLQTWDTTVDVTNVSGASINSFVGAKKGSTATFLWDADIGNCGAGIWGVELDMAQPKLTFKWRAD